MIRKNTNGGVKFVPTMPFEKRSKSFRQATHDMLIKLKEIRESFSSNKQEKCNDARKITQEASSPLKSSIKRQKSCSLKDISSMSAFKDPECQSLKLESKTKSFNSVQNEVAAQKPAPNFAAQLKNSNLFNRQATLHNRRSLSVDHLSASNVSILFISHVFDSLILYW